MIYAEPGSTFYPALEGAPTGATGTIAVQVIRDSDGVVVIARATTDITEQPASSGHYVAERIAPLEEGEYSILWDVGGISPTTTASEDLTVTYDLTPDVSPGPTYTTPILVRAELGLTEDQLSDQDAIALILDAEDLTDSLLGARCVDEDTGRKVVENDVETGQWRALRRFATKLTARLYTDPDLRRQQWGSQSQAGVSKGQPVGSRLGPTLTAQLDQTGLRRLTTHASGRRSSLPAINR